MGESSLRERISAQSAQIKAVANQMVDADRAVKALPISAQIAAHSLADHLKSISNHLAGAASQGAMTAHKLSQIANAKAQELNEVGSLEENAEALKSVIAMTKGANDAAQIGLNLLAANKETVIQINKSGEPDAKPRSRADFYATDAQP